MAGDKTQFDPANGSTSFEDYDLTYTPDELDEIIFEDGLDDYEQTIIRAYNEGMYGPERAPEDWPQNFRNQSVLTRSIPTSTDVRNTPENKNAQLIASYQDKLNQIFELACQLPNTPVAGMSYGTTESDFIPLECLGSVNNQTIARLQDFENFFAPGLDISTRWGIGFTTECQNEIDVVLAAVNGEAWDYEYYQDVEGEAVLDEALENYEPAALPEAPLVGSLDPEIDGSAFTSEGLLYAARHSGELKLLDIDPNEKDPKTQCSNYARKLVQNISSIPYDLFQDAWNVRQYLAPYTVDHSDISMRDFYHFYQGIPQNVNQGPEYQAALESFYVAAMEEPFSMMTLFYENTHSGGATTRRRSSDSVSHIGMSLGGITSTETVNGNQSLAQALMEHYRIQPGLEFLLGNIEVKYQGQSVYYNPDFHEFINDAGDIIQLGEGNQAVQVTDVRFAHQVGNYQGFVSLIYLLGTGKYHPADLMPIQDEYLLPEYQDLKHRIQSENGNASTLVASNPDLIPVTDTFYLNPGENLSSVLHITGEKYSLFQLYCADQMGIFINQPFSDRQQFSVPDFEAYKANLDSRGGKQAVARAIADEAYPSSQYATFVVGGGQDPYDLLNSWFGSDFVFSLTPEIKDKLIGSIFDYNNYFVGQWPNRDAADWGSGMIFAMSHEDVAQYKDWATSLSDSYQRSVPIPTVTTVTVKGKPVILDSSLVSAAQAATSNPTEQAELLALHLIEKGQGGKWAWVEERLQDVGTWAERSVPIGPKTIIMREILRHADDLVDTTGAIETNIEMYARERGMTVDAARAELRNDPQASMRFATWLLGGYKRDVNRVAAGFERKYGVTVSPEQKSMAALDAFNAGGIKRAQFMGFQYMVGALLNDKGVDTSEYQVDGYAGTNMAMAVSNLQSILSDVPGIDWNRAIADLSAGKEITSGPLYDAVVEASIDRGLKPLLFLGVEEYTNPWVKTNYGLNTYRYAKDAEPQLTS